MSPLTTAYHRMGLQRHGAALVVRVVDGVARGATPTPSLRRARSGRRGKTFYETDPATLEKCFQTKTRVLSSILSVDGGNKYPLPRSGR